MPAKSPRKPARKRGKSSGNTKKILISFGIILLVSFLIACAYFYGKVFKPNLTLDGTGPNFVYIKSTDSFQDVVNHLSSRGMLKNRESFIWMAEFLKYTENVKPGRYKVTDRMNNKQLVLLLRSGRQEPVRVTFQNMRSREELGGKIGKILEADSVSLLEIMNDKGMMAEYGLTPKTALSLFLPDTYEFYWSTPASVFISKMGKEYLKFWTDERKAKAVALNLSPSEVSIVASIVQQESNQPEEWPVISGVYLNRLKKGMKLQADPTVKYAVGDFTLRRIRSNHLKVDSPYNTYKYAGLPPGPIYLASKRCMDSVLTTRPHSYLYFCARADRSGYHFFATTFEQHLQNARKYQRELNQRGVE